MLSLGVHTASTSLYLGVSVNLEEGQTINPVALADDDPDNHVLACLDTSALALSVSVEAGLFHDPGDDPNPETSTEVRHGISDTQSQ